MPRHFASPPSIDYSKLLLMVPYNSKDNLTFHLFFKYIKGTSGNKQCIVMAFDKYYSRVGNRLTLTVTIDNFEDFTRVHYVSGGGGKGLFTFDWG